MARFKYILNQLGLDNFTVKIYQSRTLETDEVLATSLLGTPVFSNIVFEAGSYQKRNGDDILDIDYPGITLNTVVFNVSRRKRFKELQPIGREGSIIHQVSLKDWKIRIEGIIDNVSSRFPKQQTRQLEQIGRVPKEIRVISPLLNEVYGISHLFITNDAYIQETGRQNQSKFRLEAISINPLAEQKNQEAASGAANNS